MEGAAVIQWVLNGKTKMVENKKIHINIKTCSEIEDRLLKFKNYLQNQLKIYIKYLSVFHNTLLARV